MAKHYQISSHCEGEGFNLVTPLTLEQLKEIEKIANHNFMDDLNLEHSVNLLEVTIETVVKSELAGATIDGCYETEQQIRYVLDNGMDDERYAELKRLHPKDLKLAEAFKDLGEMQEAEESK